MDEDPDEVGTVKFFGLPYPDHKTFLIGSGSYMLIVSGRGRYSLTSSIRDAATRG